MRGVPLEQFGLFLDAERMHTVFQERLPVFSEGKLLIKQCRIRQFRHRSIFSELTHKKEGISVVYELNISDKLSQKDGVQVFYAKAYFKGRSQIRFRKVMDAPLFPPRFGEALVCLPDLDLIVWAFPNDPLMTHLPELVAKQKVKEHFPYECLPEGLNGSQDIIELTTEVIQYRPESRCIIRYDLKWEGLNGPEIFVLYGKVFKGHEGMSISQWTQHLWERFTSDPDGCISLAQPLGYSPEVKTTWQVGISGVKLSDLIDESNYETFMYEIVKGLAGLHGSDYRVSRQTGAYDWLERIRTGMTALIRAYPKYEATLVSIVSRLEKIAPYLSPMPDHLIHGDFHMDQLLISDDQIVFFDFDDLAMGDPMQDLAKFMVELHFQDIDPGLVKLMSMSFFHAYQSQAKWEVPMDRLTWHIELQCLKKASRLFLEEGAGLRDIIHTTELARNIILEVSNVRQKP